MANSLLSVKVDFSEYDEKIAKYLKDTNDYRKVFNQVGRQIVQRGRAHLTASLRDPVHHPAQGLAKGIRNISNRKAIRVKQYARVPYAGVHHWGRDGSSGPRYLERAKNSLTGSALRAIEKRLEEAARLNGFK